MSASLASDTGLRPPGFRWSDAPKQMVHVGEVVEFDFILLDSLGRFINAVQRADYAVAIIGDDRIASEPDLHGRFQFEHRFDGLRAGQRFDVLATAFRQRGRRDYAKVRGQWLRAESPYDDPDQAVAGDSIRFLVYEAPIEFRLVRPADDLMPETGVLTIRRSNGTSTSVYIDRPHRPGFSITGPEPEGYYRIRYVPSGRELNPVGTTEVELVIYDATNHPHHAIMTLETP